MRLIDAASLEQMLDFPTLIDRLDEAFRLGATVPVRHHHSVPVPGGNDGMLLLMPAWRAGDRIGIKIVTVFPDNAERALPSVLGSYILLDANTGQPLALLDGRALTLRRTAAVSALAARYLASKDAATLLMVGTGALAPYLVRAHAAVRPLQRIMVWGRDRAKAALVAEQLSDLRIPVEVAEDLAQAVPQADIVSCATLSRQPLVQGQWLRPGAHVDLVGGFTPQMREADDAAISRSVVYVDTRDGALSEAGDLTQPIASGILTPDAVRGDLADLARGRVGGRTEIRAITLFKSVGTALSDLAAAELAADRCC